MRHILGEGVFDQLLADQLTKMGVLPFVWEWYTRAFFKPLATADQYLSIALSGKHRKALRRRAELLAEKGTWKYVHPEAGENIQTWIDSFLRIESSGWKGREGSAMASDEAHRNFFTEVIRNAFHRNRLLMPAILLNDTPIAQNCYFLAGHGSFHFKPAFDEEYAQFSPGFQMECETIRYLHGRREIEWMDSVHPAETKCTIDCFWVAELSRPFWFQPVEDWEGWSLLLCPYSNTGRVQRGMPLVDKLPVEPGLPLMNREDLCGLRANW